MPLPSEPKQFMADFLTIEVVYAEPEKQKLIRLKVPAGTTIIQAVELANMKRFFPNFDLKGLDFGIFSQPQKPDFILQNGQRVEIYRPLLADPKEMRKLRAKKNH